ncbi:PAS domain-containing sensor histidine kinase [Chryseobacterium sp. MP_3.2]|uniref:PAS domain-containing sensor histidine kinase n=1 Tax=Chryseobacterium sp. MP_3.2 TaxID=3071712 RepID=UPI002E0C05C5|nr:PAS domain S-box-containing protein [Chryseobacterium sp. MP_3.2]
MKNLLESAISLESLTSLFSQAPVGLAILMGEKHVIANANAQVLEFWGKGDHVIGLPVLEALPEIANQEFPGILKEVFDTGKTIKGYKVKALLTKDGIMLTYYFDFIYSAVRSDTEITGVSVVAINVTDQVLSEHKLQESELRFKEILEISDYAAAIFKGEDLIIDFANDQMIKTWGKKNNVIGLKLEDALPELEGQPFVALLKDVFITGQPYHSAEQRADLIIDGVLQSAYFSFAYRPIRDLQGEIYAVLNVAVNVTELVEARMKAQNKAKEYRDLAEAMPHILWTTNEYGRIQYFNDHMRDFLDLDRETIDDFDFEKVIHPNDFRNMRRVWKQATLEKKVFELEFRFMNFANKEYVWFLNRATPILNENGSIKHWIGTSTNINDIKNLDAQKDTFLGIASHELKTPLTSLKLYAQVLERMLRKTGDEKNAEFAKKMDVQIMKLTSLISDLLDVTKINSGKIYLNEENFDFEKLVVETVEDQQMSTSYEIELNTENVGMVFADRERISQVITNLVSNAIKYSPHSKKVIVAISEKEGNAEMSVQDFGIGMPAKKKDKVFQQYYRIDGDEQSVFPGLGLGLYIASQIVERSHGKIWVESEENKGSTFFFSLPVY